MISLRFLKFYFQMGMEVNEIKLLYYKNSNVIVNTCIERWNSMIGFSHGETGT